MNEEEVLQIKRRKLPLKLRQRMYVRSLELRGQGLSLRIIQKKLKEEFGETVSVSTLCYWLRGLRTPFRPKKSAKKSEQKKKRILPRELREKMYEDALILASHGFGCRKIVKELKEKYGVAVTPVTVSFWVRGLHTPFGPKLSNPPKLREAKRLQRTELQPSPDLAYVLGAIIGDGYVTITGRQQKVVVLKVKDRDFAEKAAECLTAISGRPTKIWYYKKRGLYGVQKGSAALYNLLRPLDINKLRFYVEHCEECICAFLRGFFDAEASFVIKEKNKGALWVFNTNLEILMYIKELLNRIGIETSDKPQKCTYSDSMVDPRTGKVYRHKKVCYRLYIRARSLPTFYQKVGFTIERKRRLLEEYLRRRKPHPSSFSSSFYRIGFPLSRIASSHTIGINAAVRRNLNTLFIGRIHPLDAQEAEKYFASSFVTSDSLLRLPEGHFYIVGKVNPSPIPLLMTFDIPESERVTARGG